MLKIETIENDIKDLTEHLDFMKGIIHSYSVVNEIFIKIFKKLLIIFDTLFIFIKLN